VYLERNLEYTAIVYTSDPEEDLLTYRWEIRPEVTYFQENNTINYNMTHLFMEEGDNKVQFIAPKEEGAYRIFVFVYDGNGNVASYNIPFYVILR
jgi:hypothetical protein